MFGACPLGHRGPHALPEYLLYKLYAVILFKQMSGNNGQTPSFVVTTLPILQLLTYAALLY